MNHNSFAFILSTCDDIITCTGFVAGMVAKYALLCTFVWKVVVPIGC